jgi:N-terminal half of MaoC dehydratase
MNRTMTEGSNLAQGSWEEAEAMVGQTLLKVEGVDPVSKVDIRRKLEAMNFASPVHEDEAAAQAAGYRDVISPVSMTRTWATPAYWKPGDPPNGARDLFPPVPVTAVTAPGDHIFGTGTRTRYLKPVYPGDRLTSTAVLVSVTRKTLSVGEGAFMLIETTYENQDGETVALEELTVFRLDDEVDG